MGDEKALSTTREKAPIQLGQRGLELKDHAEMYGLAGMIQKTAACPRGYKTDDVFIAILTGSEYGFSPMRSLTAVPVINGRPTLEGKASVALIQNTGVDDPRGPMDLGCEGEGDDRIGWCESWRKGWPGPRRTEFTWKQAKRAGLADGNVYKKYGEDMIMWKAVGRHVNKYYADITHGLMLEVTGQEVHGTVDVTVSTDDPQFASQRAEPASMFGIAEQASAPEAQDAEVVTNEPVEPGGGGDIPERDVGAPAMCMKSDPGENNFCMMEPEHEGGCDWHPPVDEMSHGEASSTAEEEFGLSGDQYEEPK